MKMRTPGFLIACLILAIPAASAPVDAAPRDTRVGQVRAIFSKRGITLRESKSTLGKPVATLAYGTRVRVVVAQLPWIQVQTLPARGGAAQSGWLRAWETTEPSVLSKSPAPAHLTSGGGAGTNAREVSAAGRQLDAGTERGYRAQSVSLQAAYRLVDRMEADTAALDPADAMMFIDDGSIGRARRVWGRPARIPGGPARAAAKPRGSRAVGGLLRGLGGEAARRLGAGRTGARVAESAIGTATEYVGQVRVKFSPRQEYYLGRAVAAQAIARYGIDKNAARRRYVRLVAEAIVRTTNRLPGNFGGYHFDVLDSDEINGVSGPGGFVLVTRGAVEACQTENELASILAHELAHISGKHGESIVRKGREFPVLLKGLASAGGAAAGGRGGQFANGLVRFFGQVVSKMSTTAMSHSYGRNLEFAADAEGTRILHDVWYDPAGMRNALARLPGHGHAHGGAATHASPAARAQALGPLLAQLGPFKGKQPVRDVRRQRFLQAVGRSAPQPK